MMIIMITIVPLVIPKAKWMVFLMENPVGYPTNYLLVLSVQWVLYGFNGRYNELVHGCQITCWNADTPKLWMVFLMENPI